MCDLGSKTWCLILLLLSAMIASAEGFPAKKKYPLEMTLEPSKVAIVVLERKVRIQLKDNFVIKGKVISGDEKGLVIQRKGGNVNISVQQISDVSFRRERSKATYAVPVIAGFALMGLISQDSEHGEYGWIASVAALGSVVLLHLTRPTTRIHLLQDAYPEGAQAPEIVPETKDEGSGAGAEVHSFLCGSALVCEGTR